MTRPAAPPPPPEDLEELRRLAEAATPGPWSWSVREESRPQGGWKIARLQSDTAMLPSPMLGLRLPKRVIEQESWYVFPDEADRDYLAAVSPDRILALLNLLAEKSTP